MNTVPQTGPELHKKLQSMGNRKFAGNAYRNPMCEQRVGLCIDIQNLYYSAKDLCGAKVNYNKLLDRVTNGRKLVKAVAYIANSKTANNQSSFIGLLRGLGCDIRQKNIIEREDGSKKCDWDVEIAVDAMAMADKIDVFVLASGDGDFVYLLKTLKHRGVRCEVMSFKENTSNALMDETDKFTIIDDSLLLNFNKKPVDPSFPSTQKLISEENDEI